MHLRSDVNRRLKALTACPEIDADAAHRSDGAALVAPPKNSLRRMLSGRALTIAQGLARPSTLELLLG